jgi:hypothetical protein
MPAVQNLLLFIKNSNPLNANTSLVKGHLVVNKAAANNTIRAGEFLANAAGNTATANNLVGVYSKISIQGPAVQITGAAAAAHLVFDVSAGANTTSNAVYGLIIDRVKDGANSATAPTAFIGIGDAQTDVAQTPFLLDIGRPGFNANANVGILRNTTPATSAGALVVRVNGATRYIQLFSAIG